MTGQQALDLLRARLATLPFGAKAAPGLAYACQLLETELADKQLTLIDPQENAA